MPRVALHGRSKMPYLDPMPRPGAAQRLATLIRTARRRLGWTQEDLAAESGVGVRTIIRWERAQVSEPSPAQLRAVAEALGIPPDEAWQAVGWLPEPDEPEPDQAPYTDPDEAAIWAITRLPEQTRRELIAYLRARRALPDDASAR